MPEITLYHPEARETFKFPRGVKQLLTGENPYEANLIVHLRDENMRHLSMAFRTYYKRMLEDPDWWADTEFCKKVPQLMAFGAVLSDLGAAVCFDTEDNARIDYRTGGKGEYGSQ